MLGLYYIYNLIFFISNITEMCMFYISSNVYAPMFFVNCTRTAISSINYNTDTGLDVVFDSFSGPVFTVTSTCTCIRVHNTPWLGTQTGLLCTPVLEIDQRRHPVRYLCCYLPMCNVMCVNGYIILTVKYSSALYNIMLHCNAGPVHADLGDNSGGTVH